MKSSSLKKAPSLRATIRGRKLELNGDGNRIVGVDGQRLGRSGEGRGTTQDHRRALAGMYYRCLEMNGRGAHEYLHSNFAPVADALKDMLEKDRILNRPANDDEKALAKQWRTEMCGIIERARNGSQEALSELNALHITQVELFVRATSNFTSFFRLVNLKPDEQAVFEHSYRNEVRARFIGQDGGIRTTAAVKAKKQVYIDLKELVSDDIGYPIRDINLGADLGEMARATVDVAFDVANQIDLFAYNLYVSLLGAFTTTGAKLNRTWIPNSRINSANLPTTNVWDLSLAPNVQGNPTNYDYTQFESPQATTPSKLLFRLAVCRATMAYCAAWGNIFGAPMKPTGIIYVPSSESAQLSQEIVPTGTTFNRIADTIMENFTQFDYMGIRWVLVPDVTLAPGQCFPVLGTPVGDYYAKPEMDEEFVTTDRRKNWETRAMMKVFNMAAPEPWRVNAFSVIYHH